MADRRNSAFRVESGNLMGCLFEIFRHKRKKNAYRYSRGGTPTKQRNYLSEIKKYIRLDSIPKFFLLPGKYVSLQPSQRLIRKSRKTYEGKFPIITNRTQKTYPLKQPCTQRPWRMPSGNTSPN